MLISMGLVFATVLRVWLRRCAVGWLVVSTLLVAWRFFGSGSLALRDGQPACAAVALAHRGFPAPRTLTSDARAKRELSLSALVTSEPA
jgi:hypothetical protein